MGRVANECMQVFELWEKKNEQGESKHYVRVLYNKQPLSLAKHPEGWWFFSFQVCMQLEGMRVDCR